MKIYIAGHAGLVGSALVRQIENHSNHTWIGVNHSTLDLCEREAVFQYIKNESPDAIILAAAKVGGIKANSDFPVDFLTNNLQIQSNVLDGAHAAGISNLVFLGSSCIYPKYAEQPIREDSLLTGSLEQSNEAYAIAKIAGIKLVDAYRRQFGRNWISVMPTNLYGLGDTYDLNNSHVIPALIKKLHNAERDNSTSVSLWGTGRALREFLHADDLASACILLLENYRDGQPINVGSGEEISIKNLAQLIARIVGFKGEIKWDESKPDGTPRKLLDSSRIKALGWMPSISLEVGVEAAFQEYLHRYPG